jgi:DNA-binding beta-propeller fold protein YncE
MSRLLLSIAASAMLLGAQTPVGGPSLGFIFDAQGQALRPILGIPGAAIFGDPLQAPAPISTAAFSLRQNVAIVNDGAWKVVGLGTSTIAPTVLPDGLPTSARVSVSESGSAAAFYDSSNAVLSVVTGLTATDGSMAANAVALGGLPGGLTALAASDDGSLLVTSSVPDGGGEALMWLGQDGSTRQLASLQKTSSILLWNHGANALVVDRGANQVWSIQDPGGSAAITLLASDADGVSGPTGAALSTDGKQLWIANADAHTVLGIDTTTRATQSLSVAFDLTALHPFSDGQTFRLTRPGNGPMWMLDAAPGVDPRVVFVPAVQIPASSAEATQ